MMDCRAHQKRLGAALQRGIEKGPKKRKGAREGERGPRRGERVIPPSKTLGSDLGGSGGRLTDEEECKEDAQDDEDSNEPEREHGEAVARVHQLLHLANLLLSATAAEKK